MGFRFDLSMANWLAHVLEEKSSIPKFPYGKDERDDLLRKLEEGYVSSVEQKRNFSDLLATLQADGDNEKVSLALRKFFGNRPWTALIVPSGSNPVLDNFLCSDPFLGRIVQLDPGSNGLILQMSNPYERFPDPHEGSPYEVIGVLDVFPAVRTALAESTSWPGILFWTREDSAFLPFHTDKEQEIENRTRWIFGRLKEMTDFRPKILKQRYLDKFPPPYGPSNRLTILQLSDLHIGSKEADDRIPRLQTLIRKIVDENGGRSSVLPIVTGDLIDDPEEKYLKHFRWFYDTLRHLTDHKPILLLGNHDIRRSGLWATDFNQAMRIEAPSTVYWKDNFRLGIVAFDSVRGGDFAQGSIGEEQLHTFGNELDRRDKQGYTLIGVLHHHPIKVRRPSWYAKKEYERVFGSFIIGKTTQLMDSANFLDFAHQRRFAAILHGHEHIPHLDKTPHGIPVFGCGSSVGKATTQDGRSVMSINLVTFDRNTNKVAGSLLVESTPGGGLHDYSTLMYNGPILG